MKKIRSILRGHMGRFTDAVHFFPTTAIVLLVVVWVATFNLIRAEFADARKSAITVGRELLVTYEAQALRSLREIDQSLKIVRYAHETSDASDTLETLQTKDLLPPTVIFSVCILDRDGRVISSTDTGYSCTSNQNFLDEIQQTDALVISNPRESAEPALSFGRQLSKDGSTAGAVVITVEPAYFVSGYEVQKYGSKGLNGLLGEDGIFRALRIGDTITAGERAVVHPRLLNEAANDTIQNYWDGVKRYTFTRPLFGYPLTAVVGLAESEQLATARSRAQKYLIRAAAGSVFLILVFTALFRESKLLSLSRKREHEQAAQVEYMAYHDVLTGLANRGLFSKLLYQELTLAKRNGRSFSLLFLDLDHFKPINDTLGHDAGDQLLIEVAKRLKQCLRSSDVVARIGGDEFVVLLPSHKDSACAEAVAQKIISAIAEPYHILGQELTVTASIGISMFPKDGQEDHTLMKNADTAMYSAKAQGKNNYQFYSGNLPSDQKS